MGHTGFCEILQILPFFLWKSAVSSGFLRASAPSRCCKFQEHPKIKNQSAKKKLRIWLSLSILVLVCPFHSSTSP